MPTARPPRKTDAKRESYRGTVAHMPSATRVNDAHIAPTEPTRVATQTVGNMGPYFVRYRLSQHGWKVMPTARNAKGIDILAYSHDGKRTVTRAPRWAGRPLPVAPSSGGRRSPSALRTGVHAGFPNDLAVIRVK